MICNKRGFGITYMTDLFLICSQREKYQNERQYCRYRTSIRATKNQNTSQKTMSLLLLLLSDMANAPTTQKRYLLLSF